MKTIYFLLFQLFFSYSLHAQCWKEISAGSYHTVAIQSDGTLWTWGFNGSGQLGNGTTVPRNIPVQIGADSDWMTVSAGQNHNLAVKNDGTLWAWGDNLWGQVGTGSFGTTMTRPVKIGLASDWKSVSAGSTTSFGFKTNGTLWAWGDNFFGQLGIKSSTVLVPTQVDTARDWKSISSGANHTVALKTDGSLWSWGFNVYGQLGDGTDTDRNYPAKIGTANDWQSVDAGENFVIALKNDQTLWAWGNNDFGQLGDGSYIERRVPTKIEGSDWKSIAAGAESSLAVKSDGTLWSWGYIIGRFGQGTNNTRVSPAQIGSSLNWLSIIAGYEHAFAFQTYGTLWGWGNNSWGKIGNGNSHDKFEPELLSATTPIGEAAQIFCEGATVSNLQAEGTDIKWYNTESGGTALSSNTALINGNDYFASQTKLSCESESRLKITVEINTTPTSPPAGPLEQIFCGPAAVSDLIPSGENVVWYATAVGGTPLEPKTPLRLGLRYFASQTENGCESSTRLEVAVTIHTTPPPTGNSEQSGCAGAVVSDLSATGTDIRWYTSPLEGSALPNSTALIPGNYYYASQSVNGLESCTRLEVLFSTNATSTPAPTGPSVQTVCVGSTIESLEANGEWIKWYDVPTGGSALASGSVVTHGANYYASQTIGNCESEARLEISLDVNSVLAPEGESIQTFCTASTVQDLIVSGTEIKWYLGATGGSPLSPETELINDTHYFASQTLNSCESPDRLHVTAFVNKMESPTGLSSQTFCEGATIDDLAIEGVNIKWYETETGDIELPATSLLVDGKQYFATQSSMNCESITRLVVTAFVNPNPPSPLGPSHQDFEHGKSISELVVIGSDIKWYPSSDDALKRTNELNLSELVTRGATYYATQTIQDCESNTPLAITVSGEGEPVLKYFPNPVKDVLNVTFTELIDELSVISSNGQALINITVNKNEAIIDLTALNSGTYYIQINYMDKVKVMKVIKP